MIIVPLNNIKTFVLCFPLKKKSFFLQDLVQEKLREKLKEKEEQNERRKMMKQMSVDSGNEASSEDSNDSLRSSRKRVIPERENSEGINQDFRFLISALHLKTI